MMGMTGRAKKALALYKASKTPNQNNHPEHGNCMTKWSITFNIRRGLSPKACFTLKPTFLPQTAIRRLDVTWIFEK